MKSNVKAKALKSKSTPNKLILAGKYDEAIALAKKLLKQSPHDHWLLVQISAAYCEKRWYKTAERYALKAIQTSPEDCLLVWWNYAGVLYNLGIIQGNHGAKELYQDIILDKAKNWLTAHCSEGEKHTNAIVNDCRFRLGIIYAEEKNYEASLKMFMEYLKNHSRKSIYTKSEANNRIKAINKVC